MIRLTLLPASEGDCLLLEYGFGETLHRVLIDAGRKATYGPLREKLALLPEHERSVELFVISHVDRDHIEGALELMADPEPLVTFGDVWFNDFQCLLAVCGIEHEGADMGEQLSAWLKAEGAPSWNAAFAGGPIAIPAEGNLPAITLPGGLSLTILSPSVDKLRKLIPVWEDECAKAGIMPGDGYVIEVIQGGLEPMGALEASAALDIDLLADAPFACDATPANGSSIAFIAEFDRRRMLFAADVHPDLLLQSLKRYSPDAPVSLDLFKLAHHGSQSNTSAELLAWVSCKNYAISTNGKYFKHPSETAIARVIKYGKANNLYFNYETSQTVKWKFSPEGFDYVAHYPSCKDRGIEIVL